MDKDHYITSGCSSSSVSSEDCVEIKTTQNTTLTHDIWLSSTVESETLAYADVCRLMQGAGPNDKVTLHLANRGGSVDTGIMLVNAMKNCEPGVDVIVESRCFSMGALLAVCGKSLVMRPGTWLMFHNYSSVEVGKGKEMLDAVLHTYDHLQEYIEEITFPFLSQTELKKLRKDEDVYVKHNDKTLAARIKRHFNAK